MISRKNPALQDSPPAAGRFCLMDFIFYRYFYEIPEAEATRRWRRIL